MKNTVLSFFFSLFSLLLFAEKYVVEIKPLPGEKWYGAYTAKGYCNTALKEMSFQPYKADEQKKDLSIDNRGNQAAPLLISNKGRYVWSEYPFTFEFKAGVLILSSDFNTLDAVTTGKTLREAYVGAKNKFFPASGKTPNPLMFKMPQYNTWIELGIRQNQKDIIQYADNVIKNGFPTGVFMVDDLWSKGYGNFEFDPTEFPDPKSMMDNIHDKGFKIMLWLTPFISPDGKEFKNLLNKDALVLTKDGKQPAIIHWWDGYSACLDFTKTDAVDWLRLQLKNLQHKYKVDGFKFDAGDFERYDSTTNARGTEQSERYAKIGAEFDFNEFRACWKMGNQPLAQRLQDKAYSWDDLKLIIPDMISAGLIGHAFTCPDMIGGGLDGTFRNIDYAKFDQEFFIRSAQAQALMPMMQFSVAPWRVLDAAHLKLCREAALLHAKMGEYIFSLAQHAAQDGEPIVRHLEYAFPNQGFESCDDQYMLGTEYLVAPMIIKGNSRSVKLPKGNWIDELGNKFQGGETIVIDVPLNRLPYFMLQK